MIIFGLGLGLNLQKLGIGLSLSLVALASASRFWPRLTLLHFVSITILAVIDHMHYTGLFPDHA